MLRDIRIMVFVIACLLGAFPALGVTNDNVTVHYGFDTVPGFLNDSSPNLLHFYNNTGTDQNLTKFKLGTGSAMFGQAESDEMITGVPPMVGDRAAISLWFYTDNLAQNAILLADFLDSLSCMLLNNDVWCQASNSSNDINVTLTGAFTANNWHHVWWSVNGSHAYGAYDGGTVQSAAFTGDLDGDDNLSLSHRNSLATPGQYDGLIDEVTVFNQSDLNPDDAAVLYASGAGCAPFDNESCAWVNVDVFVALIDEGDGNSFDITNVTSVTLYSDDNLSSAVFTSANMSFPLDLTVTTKFHIDIEYADGTIITRWLDYDLTGSSARVCANPDDVTHYEQIVIAGSSQLALLRNIFADCHVLADYSRFAYQNAYAVKAYTVPALYALTSYDSDGNQVTLASLDGSISAYYDLDTILFASQQTDIQIEQESLSTMKMGNSTIMIYYNNIADDNTVVTVTITRMDNDTVVFLSSDFADPNEFTIYFDYTTLSDVDNNTLFQVTLDKVTASGPESLNRYFNVAASVGVMDSRLAFALSVMIMVFGLSLAIARVTFSWFGIFILLAALVIASLAVSTWYLLMLQGIEVIAMLYIGIVMWKQNPTEVS